MAGTGLDYNILNNQKSLLDAQKLQQAFELQKATQLQALQTGGIDAATKANIYKTQLLSGAAAGGQGAYDTARANLAQQGIDTSEYAPDVTTATSQLNASRLAQSPLGTLLGAAQKQQTNDIALGAATGTLPAGAFAPSIPGLNLNIGGQQQASVQPANQGSIPIPQKPTYTLDQTINQLPANSSTVAPSLLTPANATPIDFNQPAIQVAGAPINTPQPTAPGFAMPPQMPNETIGAYKDRIQMDPNYQAQVEGAKATAGDQAKLNVGNAESAKKADELTKRLEMNLSAMKRINDDLPSTGFIPAGAKVALSQALGANGLGSGAGATAANQWDQINNQQVLSEIQQFVASGGANTRINQTLDRIVQAASGINRNDSAASRAAQIDNALAEIQNKNVSAGNLAGGNQPYQPIPVTTSQDSLQNSFNAKKFSDPASIKAAFQAGQLTKDQATALLKSQHGFTD